jgi:hypothetical protein
MTMMNAYDYHSKIVRAPGAPRRPMRDPRTARPAKGRTVTLSRDEYRYQPVPQPDRFEIETAKRYRQRVAKRLARSVGWTEPPSQPKTRMGIAIAAGQRMRAAHENHARAVARALRLY